MRLIIAGILGGIVMFIWGALSHTVLQIGDAGVRALPNEEAVISALKTNITEPGFYFFPGMDMQHQLTEEQQAAFAEKYKAGPNGILIYHPTGRELMSPMQLGTELASNIVACLIVAFLLSMGMFSFIGRLIAATLIGLTGWISIMVSYWNWYRFPDTFVLAEGVDQVVGWFLAGLVFAVVVRSSKAAETTAEV